MVSGASSHMFNDASLFATLQAIPPTRINVASKDGGVWATHRGSVKFGKLHLDNVLYSPQLTSNLVSIGRLCDAGYTTVLQLVNAYVVNHQQEVIMKLMRDLSSDWLWHPKLSETALHVYSLTHTLPKSSIASLWHLRLGHPHPDAIIKKLKTIGGQILNQSDFLECKACVCGKMVQSPSTSSFTQAKHVLDVVHSDLMGPISPPTISGNHYILTFIDNCSRKNHIYLLK